MGSIKIGGKLPVTRDRIKKFPSLMARYLARTEPPLFKKDLVDLVTI
jgi:hypothetical protein